MKIFISWSGIKSKEVAQALSNWLPKVIQIVEPFVSSKSISAGTMGIPMIMDELENTEFGIICVSKESVNSNWVMFEAGSLAMITRSTKQKNSSKHRVVPFLIDVKKEIFERSNNPLKNFQYITIDKEGVKELVVSINNVCEKKINRQTLDDTFDKFFDEFNSELKAINSYSENPELRKIEEFLENQQIDTAKANKDNGLITILPSNTAFHHTRRFLTEMLEIKKLTLVGASLYQAFDQLAKDGDSPKYIGDIIKNRLENVNDKLTKIEIFITDPMLLDEIREPTIGSESPLRRIERTLINIPKLVENIAPGKSLSIFFIPLLQLDHLVMTDDFLIMRNTLLWTSHSVGSNEYRGSWMLFEKKNTTPSMYVAYNKYLTTLKANSIILSGEKIFDENRHIKLNSLALQLHYDFKKRIHKLKHDNVKIFKVYRNQLISHLSSTWEDELRTSNKDFTWKNEDDVFFSNNCQHQSFQSLWTKKHDKTQGILKEYIQDTEKALDEIVKNYDREGFAKIIPAFNLGLPSSKIILEGGFPSGCVVLWKCGTPIVPIDSILNVCTSSYCEISSEVVNNFNEKSLRNILITAHNLGYLGNFNIGHHFIILAKSKMTGKHYLILHSSSSQYDEHSLGLYPKKNSWFYNNIKEKIFSDGKRKIRYIKDNDALKYINIAQSIEVHNVDIHKWFIDEITASKLHSKNVNSFHHHYMPNNHCVANGVYVEKENEIIPILTIFGKSIPLFKIKKHSGIILNKEEKAILPSAWGLETIESINNMDQIISTDKKYSKIIRPRDYRSNESFCSNIKGEIVDNLEPLMTFQLNKCFDHRK